ncbi:hypothetical protein GCM10023091_43340 [Ravibacter arvi]|uniref:Uncharacterized protein n=1 Tax=Ravibacter arvi TaxID=2051041 RepID=A0ABP8MCV2_9BACT
MKQVTLKVWALATGIAVFLAGCSKDADPPVPEPGTPDSLRYALLVADPAAANKTGGIALLGAFPSGDVEIGETLFEGMGMAAWKPYKNWIFKSFSTRDYSKGVEKLVLGADGKIKVEGSIKVADSTPGSGNFVIAGDTVGFYWDAASPLKIKKFNPSGMTASGEIDLDGAVKESGGDSSGINFRAVGQNFLAVKEGKLFADITLVKAGGNEGGTQEDFFPDLHIAVVDIATGKWEKNTVVKQAGATGDGNSSPLVSASGDLYVVCRESGGTAVSGNSKIFRIKAKETDVDSTWALTTGDVVKSNNIKFAGIFSKNNQLIVSVNNTPVTSAAQDAADIWEYYVVNTTSKAVTKVTGAPAATRPGSGAIEVDSKILLRVVTSDKSVNGLYELTGTVAKKVFQLKGNQAVQGLYKLD